MTVLHSGIVEVCGSVEGWLLLHCSVVVWSSGAVLTRAPLDIDGGGAIPAIGYTGFWEEEKLRSRFIWPCNSDYQPIFPFLQTCDL